MMSLSIKINLPRGRSFEIAEWIELNHCDVMAISFALRIAADLPSGVNISKTLLSFSEPWAIDAYFVI